MRSKEHRYRLLLELYPADFRHEYADEMIGVLMADPTPVRNHAPSLIAGAVTARVRQTLGGDEWRRAAFVVQLFGAMLLSGVALRRLATSGVTNLFASSADVPPVSVFTVVRVVAWTVVVVAAISGLRGLSVAAALAGLIGEVAAPAQYYSDAPVMFLNVFWIVMSAAVVLVASAVAIRGPRPRGWLFVTASVVLLVSSGLGRLAYFGYDGGRWLGAPSVPLLGAGVLALVGVIRLEAPIRRRVVACVVPVAAVFPLIGYGLGAFLEFNMRHPEEIRMLGPGQWAALVLVPALAFWVAAGLNLRLERSRAGAVSVGGRADMYKHHE